VRRSLYSTIKTVMANKTVIIFTQDGCPPCNWAKAYMSEKGIEFEERHIGDDPMVADELINKYQSRSTPTLVIGEEVMIGFDPEQLDEILAK
jgi:glutaredoxin-like YruB-family protein